MENLKRYSLKLGFDSDNHAYAQMMLNKNGDYVKRSDNEKALRSASENMDWVCSGCGRHYNWTVSQCWHCMYTTTTTTSGTIAELKNDPKTFDSKEKNLNSAELNKPIEDCSLPCGETNTTYSDIDLLVKVADYYRRNFIKGIGGQAGVVGVLLEVIAQRY